ncbi:MAG: hypothetical protein ACLQG5_03870 [Methanobacterium sp.]|jgi:hypothetical protein
MISALSIRDNNEPAKTWINLHSRELVSLNPLLVAVAPESTTAILKQGYKLDLKLEDLAEWGLAARTIRSLSKVDNELASMVLRTNHQGIAQGFILKRDNIDYTGFPEFINLMSDLTPDILKKCLESLDPIIVETSWSDRLKGKVEERQAAETLINVIIDKKIKSLMDIANELKQLSKD